MSDKELIYKALQELTPSAIKLYFMMVLEGKWEHSNAGIKLFCDTFGLSKQQYYRARNELIDKNYIVVRAKTLEAIG